MKAAILDSPNSVPVYGDFAEPPPARIPRSWTW